MVGPNQSDLECMKILLPRMYAETLKLLAAMAWAIEGHRKLEICLDDEQSLARWKVEVLPDGDNLYLHQGWKHFARALDLQDYFSHVLWYDSRSQINVMVFDLSTCCKQYPHDFEVSGSQLSLPIVGLRSFVVILKKYHLKVKIRTNNKVCTSFKYGCDKFCASNHLNIGDTCFFSVIYEATCSDDENEEWEEK
ncbi:B3 domain-containing protein Os03g0212300-like [Miscanthus floridulus]|uniref:B3 domain-containing protein Os03g0212300-like n=1 Tax=Miscanthus floridulus TaxID=154761 RepID=UPI00345A554C